MAVLTVQTLAHTGITPSYVAASASGDLFDNPRTGYRFLHVKNGGAGAQTVQVVTPGQLLGLSIQDTSVSVPAASERMMGPFAADIYNNSDEQVQVLYVASTGLLVAVFEIE